MLYIYTFYKFNQLCYVYTHLWVIIYTFQQENFEMFIFQGEISAITSVTNNIEDIPICRASSPFASESGIGLCKKGNTSASSQTRSTAAGDNPPRIPTAFTTTEAQLNKTQLCCSTAYLHTNTTPSSTSSMLLQVNQQMQSKSLATNSLHTPEFSVVKPRISTAGHSQKPHLSSVPLPNSMTISTSSLSSGEFDMNNFLVKLLISWNL